MSKSASVALVDHYAQGSTTLAWCWKATRRDGFVLAVTTCARDLLFEGVLYRAKEGFSPKALSGEASLAVANTEVDAALADDISEIDFEIGKWDGCTVEAFQVNYRDFSMGKMSFGVRTLGDIKVSRGTFNAELRGLTQSLQKVVGQTVTKNCAAVLGDARCKVNLVPLTVTGALTSVTDRRTFSDTGRAEAPDTFGAGVITMTSGLNAGIALEISSFAAGAFATYLPFPFNLAVGDTYSLTPGCRRRFTEDCSARYSNVVNYRGFPSVPGPDKALGLGGTEGTNL